MTTFLIIAILIVVSVAIWQMAKIFELTQPLKQEDSTIANDHDNKVNGYLMFAFLVFLYLMMIYTILKIGHFVLATPGSEHGKTYDTLMWITLAIIMTVQFLTQALLFYFSYRYRGKKTRKALFFADNNKLEMIWTIIPVVTLAALILYGLYAWNDIMNVSEEEEEEALIVELYAQQFNWTARYAGKDNVLGDANVRLIDIETANILGIDPLDPNAQDDIIVKELHLPVNRRVVFKIRSQDVLHSAYMPYFRAQMNCVPGMVTKFSFIPVLTTQQIRNEPQILDMVEDVNKIREEKRKRGIDADPWEFDYILLCNKICGKSHYNMQMKIVVETEEEFQEWIKKQTTFGESRQTTSN